MLKVQWWMICPVIGSLFFCYKGPYAPNTDPPVTNGTLLAGSGLVLPKFDTLVENYCALGVAPSTKSPTSQLLHPQYHIDRPFPVSEFFVIFQLF